MQFKPATKKQSKLRLAIFGPSGAGKTFSALRVATGMGGKIAVLDSEHGSASKYADRFTFDVLELQKRDIDEVCKGIATADSEGYSVLIIDSMSHAWQELLEDVDRIAKARYKGNSWSAWSEGTPKQKSLIRALLSSQCHIIATMRSKTEWTMDDNGKGRTTPKRVGMAPEQGKGIEYEFDMLMELSTEHIANIIKDRTGKYQDITVDKPGEEFGRGLVAWLADGCAEPTPEKISADFIEAEFKKCETVAELTRKAKQYSMAPVTAEEKTRLNQCYSLMIQNLNIGDSK